MDLLGFVAYKTWGLPIPGVSVGGAGRRWARQRDFERWSRGAVGVADKHRGKGYGRQLMSPSSRCFGSRWLEDVWGFGLSWGVGGFGAVGL